MENDQNQNDEPSMTKEQVLMEILENTRKTKNYIKWQLYITIALVVLPLFAMIFIIPMVLRSVGNAYGGVIQ
ncbi:MAG: hypothetical protein AAB410_00290 [Patescibacteria group bacterium]